MKYDLVFIDMKNEIGKEQHYFMKEFEFSGRYRRFLDLFWDSSRNMDRKKEGDTSLQKIWGIMWVDCPMGGFIVPSRIFVILSKLDSSASIKQMEYPYYEA